MSEFIKSITPSLNIILGAIAAMFGGFLQARFNDRLAKSRLKAEKLERAYSLCQAVYDGHKREISNARKFLLSSPEKYIENRNHPGMEMSELKMLIRSYIPKLSNHLQTIDKGHNPLKEAFRQIDNEIHDKVSFDPNELNKRFIKFDLHLKEISNASNDIKSGLSNELQKLTK